MVIKERLSTRDRLVRYGLGFTTDYVSCSYGVESHDHLFFYCPFSTKVWGSLLRRCNVFWGNRTSKAWITFLSGAIKSKSNMSKLLRLIFTNCDYSLWQERNKRIFQNSKCPEEEVTNLTVSNVNRFLSFKNLNG